MHGKTVKPIKITTDAIRALDKSNVVLVGVAAVILVVLIVIVVLWKRDLKRKIKEIEEQE